MLILDKYLYTHDVPKLLAVVIDLKQFMLFKHLTSYYADFQPDTSTKFWLMK